MTHPTDQLNIDTPEQIALELPIAGIGSRCLALVLDTLLQGLLYAIVALLAVVVAIVAPDVLRAPARLLGAFAPAALVLLLFGIYWGYFATFEALWNGQTPGKRFTRIRVIKESGRPITVIESIARNLLRAVDGLPALYAIGVITMIVSSQSRRLGDYVAGTVVVHDTAANEVRPHLEPRRPTGEVLPGASRITPEELLLIETYLHRRLDYDFDARVRTAEAIAERIRVKLELPREAVRSPDTFLETVAQQTRDAARYRQA
jgi:uncharacterized RDD family membrane protein YckC